MRFCHVSPSIFDEKIHFLLNCPAYKVIRQKFRGLKLDACSSVVEMFKQYLDHMELAKYKTFSREITGRKKDNRR